MTRKRNDYNHYSCDFVTYFPTKFSKTDDFPADCPPTTAIWGRSITIGTPSFVKASCIRLIIGIKFSIPVFPDMISLYMATDSTMYLGKNDKPRRQPKNYYRQQINKGVFTIKLISGPIGIKLLNLLLTIFNLILQF